MTQVLGMLRNDSEYVPLRNVLSPWVSFRREKKEIH